MSDPLINFRSRLATSSSYQVVCRILVSPTYLLSSQYDSHISKDLRHQGEDRDMQRVALTNTIRRSEAAMRRKGHAAYISFKVMSKGLTGVFFTSSGDMRSDAQGSSTSEHVGGLAGVTTTRGGGGRRGCGRGEEAETSSSEILASSEVATWSMWLHLSAFCSHRVRRSKQARLRSEHRSVRRRSR